jgi:hypothetical protein
MSWLYSRALVEEYLGDISSDGEQSAPSSGNHTPQAYCSPDKMTKCSRLSRFGMMFKPLTDDRGEALLMSYLAAFRAKTSPPQEKEPGSTESDQECGEKWHGSFVRFDPDSHSWKTHQCSLLGDLEPYSETWPRWGFMRDGECWEQQMSALRTSETESGSKQFWPTPRALEIDESYEGYIERMKRSGNPKNIGKTKPQNLTMAVKMLPTPNARDWKDGKTAGNRKSPGLGVVVHWSTPVADDTSYRKDKYAQGGTALSTQAGGKLNPTWVEWLMGWPLGWTDLKPLEMDRFQKWLDEHGSSSANHFEEKG